MLGRLARPGHGTVVAYVALFVALGGVSYAAVKIPKNSVGSSQLKRGAVKGSDLGANAVTSAKVKDGSLLAADFQAGELPAGPPGPAGPAGEKGDPGATGTDPEIADDSVGSSEVVDGSLTDDDLAGGSVGADEVQPGSIAPVHLRVQDAWAPRGDEGPEDEVRWVTFPAGSAYAVKSGTQVQSYQDGFGVVHLRGALVGKTGSVSASGCDGAGADALVLPEGMRPGQEAQFVIPNGNNWARARVQPDGTIDICMGTSSTEGYFLDAIEFRAAPSP